MEPMTELISEATVERAILAIAIAGPLVGLVIGAVAARVRGASPSRGLLRGLVAGLLGPLVWVLWRWFSWTVRYDPAPDPADDYFGLERVDVLFLNIAVFVAVGLVVGWLVRRARRPEPAVSGSTE